MARHFNAGSGSPAVVVVDQSKADEVLDTVKAADGVGEAYLLAQGSVPITGAPGAPSASDVRDGKVLIIATLNSAATYDIGPRIWWPGKLGRQKPEQRPGPADALLEETPAG